MKWLTRRLAPSRPTAPPLPRHAVLPVTAALGVAVAPHASHLPWWVWPLWVLAVGWRLVQYRGGLAAPPTWFMALLTGLTCGATLLQYGSLLGREVGLTLLAAMAALKLLEARTARDGVVLVCLGYLLLMGMLLDDQSMGVAVYLVLGFVAVLTAQVALTHPLAPGQTLPEPPWRSAGGLAVKMAIQAVPIVLVLFVLFPRVPGPLWALPSDAFSSRTGLSDSMEPGQISELVVSGEVAFRVRFEPGARLSPRQLYWRGPVLERFDGRRWSTRDAVVRPELVPYRVPADADPLEYSVILEPHGRPWLFALDLPATLPPEGGMTYNYQLRRRSGDVDDLLRYPMASHLDYQTVPLGDWETAINLWLPAAGNPRSRALAAQWRSQYPPTQRVEVALDWFANQGLLYTLLPARLTSAHPVDELLFTTREGFCEHFAGSFAFLMRASGVPARVVTGYQGGEYSGLGDYWIVRQSEAHAWVEVWLDERGWVRVDPTGLVNPGRLINGVGEVGAADQLSLLSRRDGGVWQQLALSWDYLNHSWKEWIIAYDQVDQRQFMDELGIEDGDWRHLTVFLIGALAAVGLGFALAYALQQRRQTDPALVLWRRFCKKLARQGLGRQPHEGPRAYVRRIAQRRPELAASAEAIGALYIALRYAEASPGVDRHAIVKDLARQVAALRP